MLMAIFDRSTGVIVGLYSVFYDQHVAHTILQLQMLPIYSAGHPYEERLELNFNIDAGRQIQPSQIFNRLAAWIHNVNQTLVGADFELFTAILINEG